MGDVKRSKSAKRDSLMVLVPKPELNLFAGWRYLFDRGYRREIRDEWQTEPAWVVASQITSGVCSVLFPLIIVGLLAFVLVSRLS